MHEPDEFMHKPVPGIIQNAMPNHREALAGRTAKHDIDMVAGPKPSRLADFFSGQPHNASREHPAFREIELVHCGVDWIDFHSGSHIETSLLEAKAEATRSAEKVYANRSHVHSVRAAGLLIPVIRSAEAARGT